MKYIEQFEQLLKEEIENNVAPGANYGLFINGKTFFGSVGKKQLIPTVIDNDIDTIYDMASLTKVISTTSLIMRLVEMGKVRLYAPVSKYLSRFKHSDITLFDLLTHSSGLPADVSRSNTIESKEKLLDIIYNADLIYKTGEKIVYSDIGFILLGEIIQVITNMTIDEFAKIELFDKLEMTSSGYNPSQIEKVAPTESRNDRIVKGMLHGKVHDEKAYILGGVAGHAGLFSTVHDTMNFIKMILNNGVFNNKVVLSSSTVDLLFKEQVKSTNGVALTGTIRNIGWIKKDSYPSCGDLVSDNTICHTGFTGTNVFIDRDNKIGFVLLTNRVHPTRENIKIIDARARLANFILANKENF